MIFEKGQKVLVIGDSISDFDRARPVGEGLFNAWGTSYVADVGALLTSVYPELGLRIVNMGISGNTVRDLKARWDSDVVALNRYPDWVCVLIGINDVWRQFDSPNMTEQLRIAGGICKHIRRTDSTYKAVCARHGADDSLLHGA